ncbi:MAG: hypothetical protein QM734_02925 [Cyclobacteriaceae bacterium]
MKNDPFQYNMWSAQLVLNTYGQNAKVYPFENVIDAFKISEAAKKLNLFRQHQNEIEGAENEIKLLTEQLEAQIASLQKSYSYKFENEFLDVMHFLESTSVELVKFSEEYDVDYLCWPANSQETLMPCFKEYIIYKFYETHMRKSTMELIYSSN